MLRPLFVATTSTDQFGKLQLDRFYLASSNTHDPYAVAVVNGARDVPRVTFYISHVLLVSREKMVL